MNITTYNKKHKLSINFLIKKLLLIIGFILFCTTNSFAAPPACGPSLDFQNPSLESGTSKQTGAIYRFSDVDNNVDALIEILDVSNATIGSFDNTASGSLTAFQPELMQDKSNGASIPDQHVDFEIRFVQKNTNTPVTIATMQATGVDIDGDDYGTKEYVILPNATSYTFENPTNLISPSTGLFTPQTTTNTSGISLTNTEAMVTAHFNNITSFRYTTGFTNDGSNYTSYHRLSSLSFDCVTYNNPTTTEPPTDTDDDGISDDDDIDDDNDGILDTVECPVTIPTLSANSIMVLESGTAKSIGATYRVNDIKDGTDLLIKIIDIQGASQLDSIEYYLNQSWGPGLYPGIITGLSAETAITELEFVFVIADTTTPLATAFPLVINDIDPYAVNSSREIVTVTGSMDYVIPSASSVTVYGTTANSVTFNGAPTNYPGVTNDIDAAAQVNFNSEVSSFRVKTEAYSWSGAYVGVQFKDYDNTLSVPCSIDEDNDGVVDSLDLDSDNDGIPDNIEAQKTVGYIAPSGVDSDGNGLDDAYEVTPGSGEGLTPVNTDSTDNVDYLDLDSDNDGTNDLTESGLGLTDANNDGMTEGAVGSNGWDNTLDRVDDYTDPNGHVNDPKTVDASITGDLKLSDEDGDLAQDQPMKYDLDYRDTSNDDGDGDGILDDIDIDDDNDGILDTKEKPLLQCNSDLQVESTDNINNFVILSEGLKRYQINTSLTTNVQYVGQYNTSGSYAYRQLQFTTKNGGINYHLTNLGEKSRDTFLFTNRIPTTDFTAQTNSSSFLIFFDPTIFDAYLVSSTGVITDSSSNTTITDGEALSNNTPYKVSSAGVVFNIEFIPKKPLETNSNVTLGVSASWFSNMNREGQALSVKNCSPEFKDDIDNDGIPNYLDLDSDNDGIPDNIEAQKTVGYIAPSGVDSDGNGLDDAYEVIPGSGEGLTPVNTDSTDNVDYFDLDSDNDGINDLTESGLGLTDANNDGMTEGEVGSNGWDNTLDRVDDYTDPNGHVNDPKTVDTSITGDLKLSDEDGDVAQDQPMKYDLDYRDTSNDDGDGDGIPDNIDIDDDNDGILDAQECTQYDWRFDASEEGWGLELASASGGVPTGNTVSPMVHSSASVTNIGGCSPSIYPQSPDGNFILANDPDNSWTWAISSDINKNLINALGGNLNFDYIDGDLDSVGTVFTSVLRVVLMGANSSVTATFPEQNNQGWKNINIPLTEAEWGPDLALTLSNLKNIAIEIEASSAIDTTDCNATEYFGLDNITFKQGATSCDIDNDGIRNDLDLDSDNDGIPDNIEAQKTVGYIAPSGVDSDGNGLDDAYEVTPGSGEGLTPVDTDTDTTPDYLDLDSDNDSIFDIAESNNLPDANSDGMTDNPVGQNGLDNTVDTLDDYSDPNGKINAPKDDLEDVDSDAAGNVPMFEDVDYRDTILGYEVGGRVFIDANVNGINDVSEKGISALPLVLFDTVNQTCASVRTQGDGRYLFPLVKPGDYRLYIASGESVPVPQYCDIAKVKDPANYRPTMDHVIAQFTVSTAAVMNKNFGYVKSPLFEPNHNGSTMPGMSTLYAHRFVTPAKGTVSFASVNRGGPTPNWQSLIYYDTNCDGKLTANESLAGSYNLLAGGSVCLINKVIAPANVITNESFTNTITATFDFKNSLAGFSQRSVIDHTKAESTNITGGVAKLVLIKTVQNMTQGTAETEQHNQAQPNDVLKYRVYYENKGNAPLTELVINDSIPAFTELKGSPLCELPLGKGLTNCTPSTSGDKIKWVFGISNGLAGGGKGVVSFEVTID